MKSWIAAEERTSCIPFHQPCQELQVPHRAPLPQWSQARGRWYGIGTVSNISLDTAYWGENVCRKPNNTAAAAATTATRDAPDTANIPSDSFGQ